MSRVLNSQPCAERDRRSLAPGLDLQLFVEMHPHLWPRLGMSVDDVRSECEAQGSSPSPGRPWRGRLADRGFCLRLRPRRA